MTERQLSDNELALLIAESFNSLPEPDHKRLLIIEHNLARPRRYRNWKSWWVAGLLLAGAAVAGWQIFIQSKTEHISQTPVETLQEEHPEQVKTPEKSDHPSSQEMNNSGTGRQTGPVIYRR